MYVVQGTFAACATVWCGLIDSTGAVFVLVDKP